MLPAFEPKPLVGRDEISRYFTKLLDDPATGLSIEPTVTRHVGSNLIYAAGVWHEAIHVQPVSGLFLLILIKDGGQWKAVADTWNATK